MAQFQYTIVADDLDDEVDDAFVSDDELGVGDEVKLGERRYVVQRVENTGNTQWSEDTKTSLVSKRLHCRRSD